MKKFNYFYVGRPITKDQFLFAVPHSWQKDIKDGEYSWGYYRAIKIESIEEFETRDHNGRR